jgi:hypothetical protein
MVGFIAREQWKTFLDDFSKRNQLRPTRLEIVGEIGDQEEERFLPLEGVSFETKGSAAGSVEVLLAGQTSADQRHVSHLIENVARIAPIYGLKNVEDGLGFEDQEGAKTILQFELLPELPPG